MNWQSVYDSAWHHPGVAFLGCAVALALVAQRPTAFLFATTALTALDSFLTGALSPIAPTSAIATPLSILFVLLGDARLWLLLEHQARGTWRRAFITAVPLTLIVPVLQALATRLWPDAFHELRRVFLVYEVLMVVALGLALGLRNPTGAVRTLTLLFFAQYVLWSVCDVLLLAGEGWALGLRLVPNALYYAAFPILAALLLRPEKSS